MREKLEFKILAIVISLLLVGILAAGFMVLTIEKKSLYSITEASSEVTANIIARDIARSMQSGGPDLTRTVISEIKGTSKVEDVSVLNHEGREAFNKAAPAEEEPRPGAP
jgi:hypothetical protein